MPEIFTGFKSPSDSNKFDKYEKDNLTIYINKELDVKDEIRVKFPKYISDLPGRELEILGIMIPTPA